MGGKCFDRLLGPFRLALIAFFSLLDTPCSGCTPTVSAVLRPGNS